MTIPFVAVHVAVSLDGRTDGFDADLGLFYEQAARWNEDATLVGSSTVLAADEGPEEPDASPGPAEPGDTRPLLVIPDSRGQVRNWLKLMEFPYWRAGVALVTPRTPADYLEYLERRGIEHITTGRERVDLRESLEQLNLLHGIERIRVDSGGVLNGVLLREGLVDEISVMVHPALVGGETPLSFFREPGSTASARPIELELLELERLRSGVVRVLYRVKR